MATTKTTTRTTTAGNAKEIKSLNDKIATLEGKIESLENLCVQLSESNSASLDGEVLTKKDWIRLKKALSSVKMPARAAELM